MHTTHQSHIQVVQCKCTFKTSWRKGPVCDNSVCHVKVESSPGSLISLTCIHKKRQDSVSYTDRFPCQSQVSPHKALLLNGQPTTTTFLWCLNYAHIRATLVTWLNFGYQTPSWCCSVQWFAMFFQRQLTQCQAHAVRRGSKTWVWRLCTLVTNDDKLRNQDYKD